MRLWIHCVVGGCVSGFRSRQTQENLSTTMMQGYIDHKTAIILIHTKWVCGLVGKFSLAPFFQ